MSVTTDCGSQSAARAITEPTAYTPADVAGRTCRASSTSRLVSSRNEPCAYAAFKVSVTTPLRARSSSAVRCRASPPPTSVTPIAATAVPASTPVSVAMVVWRTDRPTRPPTERPAVARKISIARRRKSRRPCATPIAVPSTAVAGMVAATSNTPDTDRKCRKAAIAGLTPAQTESAHRGDDGRSPNHAQQSVARGGATRRHGLQGEHGNGSDEKQPEEGRQLSVVSRAHEMRGREQQRVTGNIRSRRRHRYRRSREGGLTPRDDRHATASPEPRHYCPAGKA